MTNPFPVLILLPLADACLVMCNRRLLQQLKLLHNERKRGVVPWGEITSGGDWRYGLRDMR
jgi:hypothetical protein